MTTPSPFIWSVRRELWEHRALWIAPAVAAVVVTVGYLISLAAPPQPLPQFKGASPNAEAAMRAWAHSPAAPFDMAAGMVIFTGFVVGVLYALAALQGERRDGSLLFWKSLPVPDRTAVLAKLAIPMAAIPAITLIAILASRAVMVAAGSAAWMASGEDAGVLLAASVSPDRLLTLIYALTTGALWMAPVWGWLLLVSAWARRMPILWAIGVPAVPCILEQMAFGSSHLAKLLGERVTGASAQAFEVPAHGVPQVTLASAVPLRFLTSPEVWLGLALAALLVAAAVWLRRRREPN